MPNHLSTLGIIHTAISILAILAAIIALIREGKINPVNVVGKAYILLTVVTCITAFPIMKTGHPTAGHYLAILILVLLPPGIYAKQLRVFGKRADYVQTVILSATLFFSFIPAIIETLTRLPASHPLADGPNAPLVQMWLMVLAVLFVTGVLYQVIKLRSLKRSAQKTEHIRVS